MTETPTERWKRGLWAFTRTLANEVATLDMSPHRSHRGDAEQAGIRAPA